MPTIFKPLWVRHEGTSIYSVDIHPDGTKFATGGADNRALIWRLAPVLNEPSQNAQPKLVCAVLGHEQSVNAVRWSPNGRFLATGSGDGRVGLAERAVNPAEFGASANSEVWRIRRHLPGSGMEFWDLAWSPDSTKIAACCHDFHVYVWDVTAGSQSPTILKGHSSVVKGIVWDPIGSFLATQDDNSMIIWRVDGWKMEKQITEPFVKTPETVFRRPSWSSDGSYLVAAAAMPSGTNAPLLIARETWKFGDYPVGHKALIAATAVNPSLFAAPDKSLFICYALADVHQVLTIWVTSQNHALAVIANGVEKPATDLRWSPDGNLLIMSSLDGTILVLKFDEHEIGPKLSEQERESNRRNRYGAASGALIEDPALLALYQERKQREQRQLQESSTRPIAQPTTPQKQLPTVQKEFIDKGRRRIIPTFVTSTESTVTRSSDSNDAFKNVFAVGNITPVKASSSSTPAAPSTPSQSARSSTVDLTSPDAPNLAASTNSNAAQQTEALAKSRNALTTSIDIDLARTITEKKRGRPAMAPQDGIEEPAAKRNALAATSSSTPSKPISPPSPSISSPPSTTPKRPSPTIATQGAQTTPSETSSASGATGTNWTSPSGPAMGIIGMLQSTEMQKKPRGRPPGQGRRAKQTATSAATNAALSMDIDEGDSDEGGMERVVAPRLLLPLVKVARRFGKKIVSNLPPNSLVAGPQSLSLDEELNSGREGTLEVTVIIDEDGLRPPKSTLKYVEGHTSMWQDHVEDKVTTLTGNSTHLMAAGCASGDVYIWSTCGRRLFPAINVSSTPICALECFGSTLMAVACDGIVKLWDIGLGIAKADTSLQPMMAKFAAQNSNGNASSSTSGALDPNNINAHQQYADLEETLGLLAPSSSPFSASSPSSNVHSSSSCVILYDFISKFAVSETGQAMYTTQSGQIYGYSTMMASWVSLYAPNWQKDADKTGVVLGQLSSMQRTSQRAHAAYISSSGSGSGYAAYYSSWHGLAIEEKRQRTVAHLEAQVSSAALFGTVAEYKQFAKLYARELAELLHEKKLAEFLRSLLGPIHHSHQASANSQWDPYVHGVPKREILEEILVDILRPELQRLISTVHEALQSTKSQRALRSPPLASRLPAPSSRTISSPTASSSSHHNGVSHTNGPTSSTSQSVPSKSSKASKMIAAASQESTESLTATESAVSTPTNRRGAPRNAAPLASPRQTTNQKKRSTAEVVVLEDNSQESTSQSSFPSSTSRASRRVPVNR